MRQLVRDKLNNQESMMEGVKNVTYSRNKLSNIDQQIRDLQSNNKPIPLGLRIYKSLIKKIILFREKNITEINDKLSNIEKDLKDIINLDDKLPLGNRIYKGIIKYIEIRV